MSSISILGAGWLGMPLARYLRMFGHDIVLSKRDIIAVDQLRAEDWKAEQYQLGETLPAILGSSDIAIINIPPGRRNLDPKDFIAKLQRTCRDLLQNETKNIIFVSTTSVYGDTTGTLTEITECRPTTNSGKAHLEIEQYIHALMPKQATILRLAGLVGGKRHPAKNLSGKQHIPNPHQVVNLVHRNDVIAAIHAIINKQLWGHTLHLAATDHPKRGDYYRWAAKQLKISPPEFAESKSSIATGKIIDATMTLDLLTLELGYPSPFDML